MSDYPYLALSHISIDPALARQLPRQLAYFYLALPIARDDDQLTLVMAHPENQAVIGVLEVTLGAHIVPVQGSSAEIKASLNLIWSSEVHPADVRILCWGATAERAALAVSVSNVIGQALSASTMCLDASRNSLDTVLSVAHEGQYSLTVIDAPHEDALSQVLRQSSTPVLLVRGAAAFSLRHILLVLRGHSPDESALNWVLPLAENESARVTLFMVAPAKRPSTRSAYAEYGVINLLSADSEPGKHVMACARRLTEAGIEGLIRLRQGTPEQEIAHEVLTGSYDLITIAAETNGDFVQRVLRQIDALECNNQQPVLVVKPITD